jgi:uncharacterized protein (DUF433 family)
MSLTFAKSLSKELRSFPGPQFPVINSKPIAASPGSKKGSTVAPVNAGHEGARRAGQGRACGERSERTLDAPKRFPKMLRRSDGLGSEKGIQRRTQISSSEVYLARLGTNLPQVYPADMSKRRVPAVQSHPEIMSGTLVFAGTRVPFQTLIDYIEAGQPLSEFLEDFPTVSSEQAIGALEEAKEALLTLARPA